MTDIILTIQNRIIALCPLITLPTSNIHAVAVASEDECGFSDSEIPAFVIHRGPALRSDMIDVDTLQETRLFLLLLLVMEICDNNDETALAMAADCVPPVKRFFAARGGLEIIPDDGGIVSYQTINQDSGDVRRFTVNNRAFSGAVFRMQVTTREDVNNMQGV